MTMPSPEPSPQILTERSASFNRAEFNKIARIKSSNIDNIIINISDVESMENLTCEKASVRHIRHSSLDSHPPALHPINLNSKFHHLCSFPSPLKTSAKVSEDQADKESSFFLAPDTQREGGGETQEELSLEPHESLLQDAQEESFSTSLSAESKSPREDPGFILWGNAAFCVSEAKDLSSCNTGSSLQRQSERLSGESIKNHQGAGSKNVQLLSRDEGLLCPQRGQLSPNSLKPDCHLVASAVSTLITSSNMEASMAELEPSIQRQSSVGSMEASMVETEPSIQRQSSVGSTLSVHDSSTIQCIKVEHRDDSSKQKPLMSSEALSCCLDFGAHYMETLAASDCKIPAEEANNSDNSSKEINGEGNAHTQEASLLDTEMHQEGVLIAAEEVKIRAELELEIERDLEQEIKTKIFLLNRRLEELRVLKATRHPTQDQGMAQMEEEYNANTAAKVTKEAPLPKSPPNNSPKKRSTIEQSKGVSQAEKISTRASLASSKKQTPIVDKDVLASHANTPLTSWRRYATASGWTSHTKENSSLLTSSDGSLKNMKISKNSIEGLNATAKGKGQVESTSSFKQDYQSWTAVASSKKFDWIRTLRSDVPCTPRVSSMKLEGGFVEDTSPFIPSSKEAFCGNVVRTLFKEDRLPMPKQALTKVQRRESGTTPLAGSLKRSVFSSSKPHGAHADAIASTPRIRSTSSSLLKHDNASRSTSAKRLSQKPPLGVQASQDPQKSPEPRQVKISTSTGKPSSVSRVSPQQASSKVGKIGNKSNAGAPSSRNQTSLLKSASPTHAEKPKRYESVTLSVAARSVSSKDIKAASVKTPLPKQVSCVPQARASRIAPSPKPKNSSSPASKGRVVPVDNFGKRQSSTTPLKTTGASATREKVPSSR